MFHLGRPPARSVLADVPAGSGTSLDEAAQRSTYWRERHAKRRATTLDEVRADVLAVLREAIEPMTAGEVAFVLRATDGLDVQPKAVALCLAGHHAVAITWENANALYAWDEGR